MNETKELHYRYNIFYLAIIMLAIIVVLITIKWGCIQDLVNYISFGLTLTSLFLAFIAIIYAIISNSTFSQHLGTLRNVTQGIAEAAGNLSKTSEALEAKLVEIPGLIHNMEKRLDETRKDIMESVVGSQSYATERPLSREKIIEFIDGSSFSGMLALYTVQQSYSTKKPFDITKVWLDIGGLTTDYGFGFLIACTAMGIMGHTTKDDMWSITFLADEIPDIRTKMRGWLENQEKTNPKIWKDADMELKMWVEPIDSYFKD